MNLQFYMAHRRWFEVTAWILLLAVGFFSETGIGIIETIRDHGDVWINELVILEGSSHLATGIMIPALLIFDSRFPLSLATWRRNLPLHALFTLAWSLGHVTLMYWGRVVVFQAFYDQTYAWRAWGEQFLYEYLKDFRTYIFFVVLLYLYRFVLRRWQGEAGFVSEGHEDKQTREIIDRLLIKKLGKEFLVKVGDIDWIESSGNYVNLHVGDRVYPLRETMTGISARLGPQGFQRVHRTAVVNLDRVEEIVAFETGDGEARLSTAASIPVSRRYRKELRSRIS
jgi:hypothetical protein